MNKRLPVEYLINMYADNMLLLQETDIKAAIESKQVDINHPYHIYIIGKRPKVTISEESFISNGNFNLIFKVQRENNYEEINVIVPLAKDNAKYSLEMKYPFNKFTLLKNDKYFGDYRCSIFMQSIPEEFIQAENIDFLDLEIMYIGQAFGSDGKRKALDRLKNHSTLQEINADINDKYPDSDVFIILASFEELNVTMFDGRTKFSDEELLKNNENFLDRFHGVHNDGISKNQKINFIEASLINHFKPKYNKDYKNNFPDKNHTTYTQCYDLDIHSVGFEINTVEKLHCRLYTDNAPKEDIIISSFPLNSVDDRKSLFDI